MSDKPVFYSAPYFEMQPFDGFSQDVLIQDAAGSARSTSLQEAGDFQSANFVTGVSGWRLRADGSFEGNNGNFRGDITGASGTFSGTVTASAGTIGGFNIGADYIRDAANSMGLASTVTGGDDVRFWAGDTFANRASAPFRITEAGAATFSNITATGTIYATAGFIGSATALVYESQGINVGTSGYIRGGQTDYATGTGFFLGYSGGAYKLSLGDGGTTNYLHWDGSTLTIGGHLNHVAGNILYKSANTGRTEAGTTYTKKKEILVNRGGTYRIKFDLSLNLGNPNTAYGQIFRNGSAVGTERTKTNGVSATYSEDISGWSPGDLIQLYAKIATSDATNSANVSNFQIYVLDFDAATVNLD